MKKTQPKAKGQKPKAKKRLSEDLMKRLTQKENIKKDVKTQQQKPKG
jgi:hypothetical protein